MAFQKLTFKVIEAREDDFESFSCTDEDEDEAGQTSLDSSNR